MVKNIGFLHNMLPPQHCVTGPRWVNGLPSATGSRYILLGLCAFALNIWRKMILVSITLGCCFFWEMYLSHYIAELPLELLFLRHCLMRCFSVVVNKRLLTPDWLLTPVVQKRRSVRACRFLCKVCHAPMFLQCKFQRDRSSQSGILCHKLLEASSRVDAIVTTVASHPVTVLWITVNMNLGHTSHHVCPHCQSCDKVVMLYLTSFVVIHDMTCHHITGQISLQLWQ